MQTDHSIFEQVENAGAKVLVVTKYFDEKQTHEILNLVKNEKSFLALGENRIENIVAKNLPSEFCHFIGQIQSRKISQIAQKCSVVHSLADLKHAVLFAKMGDLCPDFFLQINLDPFKQNGIEPANFSDFWKELRKIIAYEKILGISGMGKAEFVLSEKKAEFQLLKNIRDEFLPNKKISAGTSCDYEIALEEGIEVVRIGQKIFF